MTETANALEGPGPRTLVLAHRPLRTGSRPATLSRFHDDRWDLVPGVFEEHALSVSVSFSDCPEAFRTTAKRYVWLLLNADEPAAMLGAKIRGNLSIASIARGARYVFAFLTFLDSRGIVRLSNVTSENYDEYLAMIQETHAGLATREDLIIEVRRMWSYREVMRPLDALPDVVPWDGDLTRELVGSRGDSSENATPRLSEDTTRFLLMWSIRYIEDFSADILAALRDYRAFWARGSSGSPEPTRLSARQLRARVENYLDNLAARDAGLPAARNAAGDLVPRWRFLSRVLNLSMNTFLPGTPARTLVEDRGLRLDENVSLDTPLTARIGDHVWLDAMPFADVLAHVRDLTTACFIVIAYLSGMRPGEVLNLAPGCVEHDATSDLWLIRGKTWKSERDASGGKLAEGKIRDDPWVVTPFVARAIAVMEQLGDQGSILFTAVLPGAHRRNRPGRRLGTAKTSPRMSEDIQSFVRRVNRYCAAHDRSDSIPPSADGRPIQPRQLRRTLAWHMYRRPRGVVAGAIQYGHVRVQMFLGYAGNYASGFPDLAAMEDLLARLDGTRANAERLAAGEHVSGPAAGEYRTRTTAAAMDFQGVVLRTTHQARTLLANTKLQIYGGKAMTCVFDPSTAKCQTASAGHSDDAMPFIEGCQASCRNIARTDRDIAELEAEITRLHVVVTDPLSPPIRARREEQRLHQLEAIAAEHTAGRAELARAHEVEDG